MNARSEASVCRAKLSLQHVADDDDRITFVCYRELARALFGRQGQSIDGQAVDETSGHNIATAVVCSRSNTEVPSISGQRDFVELTGHAVRPRAAVASYVEELD
jgi:hypothetical protein